MTYIFRLFGFFIFFASSLSPSFYLFAVVIQFDLLVGSLTSNLNISESFIKTGNFDPRVVTSSRRQL